MAFFYSIWTFHRRVVLGLFLGGLTWLALAWTALNSTARLALAFDVGMAVYLALAFYAIQRATWQNAMPTPMDEDESEWAIVLFVILASVVSLVTIALDMTTSQHDSGVAQSAHILLTVVTIFLSWLFTHMLFALHYAKLYYRAREQNADEGLLFPEANATPHYWDFIYFSCVIGTSGQTADVAFASSTFRKIGTIHCILSFFFNTTVLALMINIGASLIS